MGWGEQQKPAAAIPGHRERDLEERLTKVALVANKTLHKQRSLPHDEAFELVRDALLTIETIATEATK